MAATKKRIVKLKSEPKKAPVVVTQVVEEVTDTMDTAPLEDIKEDAKDIEEKVEEIKEDIETGQVPEEPINTEVDMMTTKSEKEEEKKELVDELFQKDTNKVMPEISVYKDKGTKSMLIWALVVVIVALLTGGALFVVVRGMPKIALFGAAPTPTPTPAPTPTPTPQEVKRSDLKLQVLNGGGVAGAGSKMKKFLEDKGYTVSDVGNATDFVYDTTSILVKASKAAFLQTLKADLQDSYTIGTASATLGDDSAFDAQVIVGKE